MHGRGSCVAGGMSGGGMCNWGVCMARGRGMHAGGPRTTLRQILRLCHKVNERAVHILLECILAIFTDTDITRKTSL